jgi:hypothetical protein
VELLGVARDRRQVLKDELRRLRFARAGLASHDNALQRRDKKVKDEKES